MAAKFEFQDSGRGVVVTCFGNLVSDDLLSINQQIYVDLNVSNLDYYIVDLSDVDSLEISADKLLLLARRDQRALGANPNLKIAFVTNHDVVASVVQLWHGYIDQGRESVRQFADIAMARTWVGRIPQQQRA